MFGSAGARGRGTSPTPGGRAPLLGSSDRRSASSRNLGVRRNSLQRNRVVKPIRGRGTRGRSGSVQGPGGLSSGGGDPTLSALAAVKARRQEQLAQFSPTIRDKSGFLPPSSDSEEDEAGAAGANVKKPRPTPRSSVHLSKPPRASPVASPAVSVASKGSAPSSSGRKGGGRKSMWGGMRAKLLRFVKKNVRPARACMCVCLACLTHVLSCVFLCGVVCAGR